MASLLYFCWYGYHFFAPGYLLSRLLGLRRGRFLLSLAISYAVLTLNLIPMEWFRAPLWVFFIAFNLQVVALMAANIILEYRRRCRRAYEFGPLISRLCKTSALKLYRRIIAYWWPPVVVILGLLIYLDWAGPYTELPADAWRHIERFQNVWQYCIGTGHFEQIWVPAKITTLSGYFVQPGCHWYILHVLFCRLSGLTIMDSLLPLSIANSIVFSLAIYWFALTIWSHQRITRVDKMYIAFLTVCFMVIWLGVSVFAYIRYYAFAPAILNYAVYLATILLIMDYLRSWRWLGHAVWLVPVLLAAMNVIHSQEAAFAIVMGMGLIIVAEAQWIWMKIRSAKAGNMPAIVIRDEFKRMAAMNMRKVHIFFIGGLVLFIVLLIYSLHRPLPDYSTTALKPVFQNATSLPTLFIQPPSGHLFQVVTWWGLFVYALFLTNYRCFLRQPFVLAGMLMPFLTVLNPLAISMLARLLPDVNAVYRFSYMIPMPFVAGFLAVRFVNDIKLWNGANYCRVIWSGICLLGLLIMLAPFEVLMGKPSNNRIYTLKPVAEGNDQRRWGDLIAFLKDHPQVGLLSDPYTCQLLYWVGLTASDCDKFLCLSSAVSDRGGLLRKLDWRHDWWLVVNRRNGDYSMNGARSGHWPAEILKQFDTFYSEDLRTYIAQHPALFKEIWNKNQIQVYDIVESELWK